MQAYSDPKREPDPYALPDLELRKSYFAGCPQCGEYVLSDEDVKVACPHCDRVFARKDAQHSGRGWFYWYSLPGCLPDSEPIGPFGSPAAALENARENAGTVDDEEGEE